MKPTFALGQRWVSNTEPALGLGIVSDCDVRTVEISFPAGDEIRRYATNNAPLTRVSFKAGDEIKSIDQIDYLITDVMEQNEVVFYQVEDASGETTILPELELDFAMVFSNPQDRLLAGQLDKDSAFRMRINALKYFGQHRQSPALGLLGARVSMLPHQMYIANSVAKRYAPRVLLADEVGLGKTIEAGLIIHRQVVAGAAKRVLILVPDTLVYQWLVEMLRRFNLHFSVYDKERFDAHGSDSNAFEDEQLVLCDINCLVEHESMNAAVIAAEWDLCVIDEAHHLEWSVDAPSPAYILAEKLSQRSQGLLLLTATPEQLGVESHFARLRLLDADRFHDLNTFLAEQSNFKPLNDAVNVLLGSNENTQIEDLESLKSWLDEQQWQMVTDACAIGELDGDVIDTVITELLDRHGTGRILYRNTRASVAGFPQRLLESYGLDPVEQYDGLLALDPLQLTPEQAYGDDGSWTSFDPRVEWLVEHLKTLRDQKVLLICANDNTALQLEERLRTREGVRSSVFHRGLSLINRDRAAAYFADPEGCQILICSEIGSEGRNFQFASHLILFDLPDNPDLLEQRIGRLDRIGQLYDVTIHAPYFFDSASERLLHWYDQGINAFAETCAIGLKVKDSDPQWQAAIDGELSEADYETFLERSEVHAQTLRQDLEQGRDRLLELSSFRPDAAEEIIETVETAENAYELRRFMERVFDYFGIEYESGGPGLTVLHLGEHMLIEQFPGLGEDGATVTFDRDTALSREDVQFLSWEHPMVEGAMELMANHEYGNTAMCALPHPSIKAGSWFIEAIFTTQVSAPAEYQIERFMPPQIVRLLIDTQGNNQGSKLNHQDINDLSEPVPFKIGAKFIREGRSTLGEMCKAANKRANGFMPKLIAQAQEKLETNMSAEVRRLQALKLKNPNIRQAEIDYQIESTQLMAECLERAQMKFDAIRIVVCT